VTPTDVEPADDDLLRVEAEQARVAIFGEVDAATASQLEQALVASSPDPAVELVVDCRGLEFIDSSGLNVFVANARRLHDAGGRLVLESLRPSTRRLFEIAGLDQVVTIRQ
jgi:anti-sigma B factor antagonist